MRPKINTNKFCKLLTKSMLVIKIKERRKAHFP